MNDEPDKREGKNPEAGSRRGFETGSAEAGLARKSQAAKIAGQGRAARLRSHLPNTTTRPHMSPAEKRSEQQRETKMGVDPATGIKTDVKASAMFPRHEQTFPDLTAPEIARMRRFGEVRSYRHGDKLFETGKPGPGMFVILSGHVTITQRDGLGHVTPVIDQGPGQFIAELGQLSGRIALVDGYRGRRRRNPADPAGAIARAAGRGSRSRRAHHARADPAPGQPDPGRRRRPGADRFVEFA